jgi:hypothetical protein
MAESIAAAASAVKDAITPQKTQFEKGYVPNATAEKEAQGGDDSRPPGSQLAMIGAFFFPPIFFVGF